MPVIIRYAWPTVGDAVVCPKFGAPEIPIWRTPADENKALAYEFKDEAEAKSFLAKHGFKLDLLKVTFEPLSVDTSDIPGGRQGVVPEGRRTPLNLRDAAQCALDYLEDDCEPHWSPEQRNVVDVLRRALGRK